MNTRAFTLSLLIAGIAVFMVMSYIEGEEAKLTERFGNERAVVVASKDIQAYELIDDTKVTIVNVPNAFLAPKAITNKEEILNTIATVPIIKGEQITKPRVTYPNVKTGLSRQVTPGKRAVSIRISDHKGASRLIKPGDRVDVIYKIDFAGGQKDKVIIKTVLQDTLVLSTGRNMSNSIPLMGLKTPKEVKLMNLNTYSNFNTVTLELSLIEAQKITWLQEQGAQATIVLRNNDDRDLITIKETTLFDVLGDDADKARRFLQRKAASERN